MEVLLGRGAFGRPVSCRECDDSFRQHGERSSCPRATRWHTST
jgi:hypothetical protein